jgi:chromosome segregation ATPase
VRISTATPILVMLLFLCAPALLVAQEPTPVPPQPAGEAQSWIMELQQIQAQLAPIQEQALQDSAIRAEQEALSADVRTAMEEVDPTLREQTARVEQLATEAQAAQAAGDQSRLLELSAEAQEIQERFAAAQVQVLQQPELASRVEAFQARLQGRMIEIEPEAEALIGRFDELQRRLASTAQPRNP